MSFNQLDLEQIQAALGNYTEAKKANRSKDNKIYYKFPKKKGQGAIIRVLPPKSGNLVDVGVFRAKHKKHGASKSWFTVECLEPLGLECPYCKVVEDYKNEIDISEYLKSPYSILQVIVRTAFDAQQNFIPAMNEDSVIPPNEPVLLSDGSGKYLEFIFSQMTDKINPKGDITDVKNGFDLIFTRSKDNGKLDITFKNMPTPLAGGDELIKYILDKSLDMNDFKKCQSDTLIEKVTEEATKFRVALKEKLNYTNNELQKMQATISSQPKAPEPTPQQVQYNAPKATPTPIPQQIQNTNPQVTLNPIPQQPTLSLDQQIEAMSKNQVDQKPVEKQEVVSNQPKNTVENVQQNIDVTPKNLDKECFGSFRGDEDFDCAICEYKTTCIEKSKK